MASPRNEDQQRIWLASIAEAAEAGYPGPASMRHLQQWAASQEAFVMAWRTITPEAQHQLAAFCEQARGHQWVQAALAAAEPRHATASSESSSSSSSSSPSSPRSAPLTPEGQFDDTLQRLDEGRRVALPDREETFQWKSGAASERTIEMLVPTVKSHIRALVAGAMGEPKAGVNDVTDDYDSALNSLASLTGTTCMACTTRRDGKMLLAGNTMPVKATSASHQKITAFAKGHEVSGDKKGRGGKERHYDATRPADGDVETYRRLQGHRAGTHAELDIVDYEAQHPDSATQSTGAIHVSFPCCMLCAAVMVATGKHGRVSGYHLDAVMNWVAPLVLSDPGVLAKFLGKTAAMAVGDNGSMRELLLRRLAGSHNGWSGVAARLDATASPSTSASSSDQGHS
jgi:hypothetical protein